MLYMQLFGKFCVLHDGRELEGFEARKVQELLCYLLLHRDHALPRETLASLLWPETTTALSRKSLRQVLWQLQMSLSARPIVADEPVLLVEPDWVRLNPQAGIELDVMIFEKAFEMTQKLSPQRMSVKDIEVLEDAVQLYQGPLLEGWYLDWCLYERERLQGMYLTMLDKLMSYYEARRDYDTSLAYGMRIMCYDRARERTHQRLMRLYYLLGDRAEALRQYDRCASALEEELGVAPSKSTAALYKQIRADQLEDVLPLFPEMETVTDVPSRPLLEILSYLTHVQETLTDLQDQVQQGIQAVELVLGNSH